MNVLLMCQGEQRRLAQLGQPKQLVEINGEPMLARTARLVRQQWSDAEITVIGGGAFGHAALAAKIGHRMLADPGRCIIEGILASRDLWATRDASATPGRTVILLGDVIWSRAALGRLLADFSHALRFAGTSDLSSSRGEVFGVSFDDPAFVVDLAATCPCRRANRSFALQQGGHLRRLLWWAQHRLGLVPQDDRTWCHQLYQVVDDYTDDLDTPADLARLPELEAADRAEASRCWTGPAFSDLAVNGSTLRMRVPPERWPYGAPEKHQRCCRLFAGGLACDCAASAADRPECGELA